MNRYRFKNVKRTPEDRVQNQRNIIIKLLKTKRTKIIKSDRETAHSI